MKEVDLLGLQLEPTTNAPLVLLAEREAPNRILPVFVGMAEGAAIAMALGDTQPPRPLTHDLMVTLVDALDAVLVRVEITEVRDQTFVADLVVRSANGELRIDARPSDAIALALRVEAPVLVSDEVLEQSGVVPSEPSEVAIEAEVDQFRAFLDGIDPDDFVGDPPAPPTTGDPTEPAGELATGEAAEPTTGTASAEHASSEHAAEHPVNDDEAANG